MQLFQRLRGALRRTLSCCLTQAQAVAFNTFLAFFPVLLLAMGVLSTTERFHAALEEMLVHLPLILPPGSRAMVADYLSGRGASPWKWIFVGLAGTLIVGTQVMTGLMDGFRAIADDAERPAFWRHQARALVLLCLVIGPWIGASLLVVFGRQLLAWMVAYFGLPRFFLALWLPVYVTLALAVAILILAVVYHVGGTGSASWNDVLPGAAAATLLWLGVNFAFGIYVRNVSYRLVYGGLAAAIGLMVWMYLSALVVFFGAAYNAEEERC